MYQHKLYNKHLELWAAPVYSKVNQHFVGKAEQHLAIYDKRALDVVAVYKLAIAYGHTWLLNVNFSNLKVERKKLA